MNDNLPKIDSTSRNGGIELLRILLMLQIIYLHLSQDVQGGYAVMAKSLSDLDYGFYLLTWLMSRSPVYLFVMITGYFCVTKMQKVKDAVPKVLATWRPMFFYSVGLAGAGVLLGFWTLSDVPIPKIFFPFLSRTWYFLTLYILVLVFAPFLNRGLTRLSKKEYLILLGALFALFSVWQPLSMIAPFDGFIGIGQVIATEGGKSLYGFVFMYVLGGYLMLHVKKDLKHPWQFLVYFMLLSLATFALYVLVPDYRQVAGYNDNPFAVLQGVCLFLFFRSLNFRSKAVNTLASMTLAVYMIHQFYLLRPIIWNQWFPQIRTPEFYTDLYPLKLLGIILAIYGGCIAVEAARRLVVLAGVRGLRALKGNRKEGA